MAGETSECSVVVLIFLILTCSVSGVMAVLFVSGRLLDYYQLKLYGTSLFEGGLSDRRPGQGTLSFATAEAHS